MRRLLIAGTVTALGLGTTIAALPSSASGPHGVGCQLTGVAKLSPGLSTSSKATKYTFTGKFSNCKGTGKVTGGTVTASGSGTASCTANTTSGTATVSWNNGTTSTIGFTTKGTGTLVQVAGSFTSGTFAGSKAKAELAFYTLTPQACNTVTGLPKASFIGPSTVGV